MGRTRYNIIYEKYLNNKSDVIDLMYTRYVVPYNKAIDPEDRSLSLQAYIKKDFSIVISGSYGGIYGHLKTPKVLVSENSQSLKEAKKKIKIHLNKMSDFYSTKK